MPEESPVTVRGVLDALGHDLDPSILIGGWATYLILGEGEISYDIDLIMRDRSVDAKLRDHLDEVTDNRVHQGRKFRATKSGVHLDIYIPHESQLGDKLRLRVEQLIPYSRQLDNSGWYLLTISAHFVTKLAALLDRPASQKGAKDARELHALLEKGVDAREAITVLATASAGDPGLLPGFVERAFDLISERSGANKNQRRKLAFLRREWVDEAVRATRSSGSPDSVG